MIIPNNSKIVKSHYNFSLIGKMNVWYLNGMQPGDVPVTYADSKALEEDYGFRPTISIREGLRKFAQWYAEYYK